MQSSSTKPTPPAPMAADTEQFELRFQSLFHSGKALAFPCDSQGDVMLDVLSARALENYLFARAVVGHEYANPVIQVRED
ncbi:MAG: hypothetical protein IV107_06810 [Paucibacter sp.]|nr:hypothetical protein [Roseateles sp.]